jgi:hypothetical protein
VVGKDGFRIGMIGIEPSNITRLVDHGRPFKLMLGEFRDCADVVLVYGTDRADVLRKMSLFNNEPGAEVDWL